MKDKEENIENLFGNLKKGQPFTIPENYFETFPDRLNARMEKDEHRNTIKSLLVTLKPLLAIAAIFVVVLLLVYKPAKNYLSSDHGNIVLNIPNRILDDSASNFPDALISNFSEEQFLSAYRDLDILESKTLTSENLADYIVDNYSYYEILANK